MKTLKEYLKNVSPKQYHIFDSYQGMTYENKPKHEDEDYISYSYNIHKNNKPKKGDVFLYRRPGKSTKNRLFNIYGGGVIQEISEPDQNGKVIAFITHPFKFKNPLEQKNSEALENFIWEKNRNKKPGGPWTNFWNQYGMNVISEKDFWGLVGDLEIIEPFITDLYDHQIEKEENEEVLDTVDFNDFTITIIDKKSHCRNKSGITPKKSNKIKIDYLKLQENKIRIGDLGESLVLKSLRKQYEDALTIEHVSKTEGDGCGYDIRVTLPDNQMIYIEVKTTKQSCRDGFYLTSNEYKIAKQCLNKKDISYHIYRIYNLNLKKKTADLKIYYDFDNENYELIPIRWIVNEKS